MLMFHVVMSLQLLVVSVTCLKSRIGNVSDRAFDLTVGGRTIASHVVFRNAVHHAESVDSDLAAFSIPPSHLLSGPSSLFHGTFFLPS
jgi:hypothetical protein